MKTILSFFVSMVIINSIYAQDFNPIQHAVLSREDLHIDIAKYKLKDGSYSIPKIESKSIKFTPSGKFLYIINDAEKDKGKFIIYNVEERMIVKTFIIPPTGMYFSGDFTYNPQNIYQLAVVVNGSEILLINNWSEVADDVFITKKGDNVKVIKAKAEYCSLGFSKDGNSLFITGGYADPIRVIDLVTGKTTPKPLPKGKTMLGYIGNNEFALVYQPNEKSKDKSVEIFDVVSGQTTRTYDISGYYDSPKLYSHCPHLLYIKSEGYILNLNTGEIDNNAKNIVTKLSSGSYTTNYSSSNSIDFYPSSDKGYVVAHRYYKEQKYTDYKTGNVLTQTESQENLYFYFKNGLGSTSPTFPDVNRNVPWASSYYMQISPNGKYMIFLHEDINNDKNSRWIISTLY